MTTAMAAMFRALGDNTRLRIVEYLGCCPGRMRVDPSDEVTVDGPTASEVCCCITGADAVNSTISHHLKELRLAGLIEMEKRGQCRICTLRRDTLKAMAEYLTTLADTVCCPEGETVCP